jgi:hypothetical protein
MSAFDIPFTKLIELSEPEAREVKRKAPAKRGANPVAKRGQPSTLALMRAFVPDPNATPPRAVNWKVGEYKHSTAMRDALARARESQPPMIILAGSATDGEEKDWWPK